ncbi:CaiB/BaiF CoA transferase family protein [Acidimangrovimonas pyrenivorans]|uniref:CaiB/BaiF CoA transferase family protein n=1 Tax=Acidimangrovimonas pyrenivorans TaxID=2030798 RepID=A0ABV7ACJ2_9RHOB
MSLQPLDGLTVLDFGHTVMGPCAGMILADLGAEVIKVEPAPEGEPTRRLKGFGTGYFGYFNRNKRSVALDLKTPEGLAAAEALVARADVLIENFAPGTMDRLGLGAGRAKEINPQLVYASLKGFMPGPYENRLALDEVVQMMTGLAYMTGPTGQPLRAGSSVIDIVGGMFAVIGILVALRDRDGSGRGRHVQSALFESSVFLMGQHLCYAAQSDRPLPPMPERVSAWAVYETFTLKDGRPFFLGITTDSHWRRFCEALGRDDLLADPGLATNNDRIAARPRLIPLVQEIFARLGLDEAVVLCEAARLPFAPVARPEDLFDDPHLQATGGLLPTTLPNGTRTRLPRLPLTLDGEGFDRLEDPPAAGADTAAILRACRGAAAAEDTDQSLGGTTR